MADDDRLPATAGTILTETGAGTRMGALLRRYWWPIAGASELDARPRPSRCGFWARTWSSTRT